MARQNKAEDCAMMGSADALEVISLDSMDMEEGDPEYWTVVDDASVGTHGQQDSSAAKRPSSSGREAMESISSPEDFSFEEEEPRPPAQVAPATSIQEAPPSMSKELKQEDAVSEDNLDRNAAENVGKGDAGEADSTSGLLTHDQEKLQSVTDSKSEMDTAPSSVSTTKVAEKTGFSVERKSEVAQEKTTEKRDDEKEKKPLNLSTGGDKEESQTVGETKALPEGLSSANPNKESSSWDTAVPTQSSQLPMPTTTTEQSAFDSNATGNGAKLAESKPQPKSSQRSQRQIKKGTGAKEKAVQGDSHDSKSKGKEGGLQASRASSRRASQHEQSEATAKDSRAPKRPSLDCQEGSAARALETNESSEDKKRTQSPRGSRLGSARGREGKENQGQGESKEGCSGEMLKRKMIRPLQSLPVDGQDPTGSQYENLEVLGQAKGYSTWELQLLKLTMADLKDEALDKLCNMAVTTHWFSMQDDQGQTKHGMMSLLFDSVDSIKAAMSLLFQMKPAEKVQRIALLRSLDGAFPVKTTRISCSVNFSLCDRLTSIQDNNPAITHGAPGKGALSEMYLLLGGLSPEVPKVTLVEMLQVLFPKAVHIYLDQHEEDKTWESFIKMPTKQVLVSTLRSLSCFRLNDTPLALYDFVWTSKDSERKDPDLLSISSDEAFSDNGLSAISEDKSEYSYIWSEELSDIMSDDSFEETDDNSRFQAPMKLSNLSVEASQVADPKEEAKLKKSRTSTTERSAEAKKRDVSEPVMASPKSDRRGVKPVQTSARPAASDRQKLSTKPEGSTTSSKKGDDSRTASRRGRPRSPGSKKSRHSPPRDRSQQSHENWHWRRKSRSKERRLSPSSKVKRQSISPLDRRRGRSRSPDHRPRIRRSKSQSPNYHLRIMKSQTPVHHPRVRRSRSRSPGGHLKHGGLRPRSPAPRIRSPLKIFRDHIISSRHPGNTSPISSTSSRSGRLQRSPTPPKYTAPMAPLNRPPPSGPAYPPSFPMHPWPPFSFGATAYPPVVAPPCNPLQPPPALGTGYPTPFMPKPSVPSKDRMLMEATNIQAMAQEALRSLGVGKGEPTRSSSSRADHATHRRSRSPLPPPRRSSPERYGRPPHGSRSPLPGRKKNFPRSRSRSREREMAGGHGRSRGRDHRSPPQDIVAIVKKVVQSILGEEIMRSRNQDDLEKVKTLTRRVLAKMGAEEEQRSKPESRDTGSNQLDWPPVRSGSMELPDRIQPLQARPSETPGRSNDYEREAERQIEANIQREHLKDRYQPWEQSPRRAGMPQEIQRQGQSWESATSRSRPYSPLSPEVPNRDASPRQDFHPGFQQEDPFRKAPPSYPSRSEDLYPRAPQHYENTHQFGRKPSPAATGFGSYSSMQVFGLSPQKPIKGILKKSKPQEDETNKASTSTSAGMWSIGGHDTGLSVPGTYADRHREAPMQQTYDREPAQPQRPHQSHTQSRGYDAPGTREDKAPRVFDYGHHGQSQEPKRDQDFFQDKQRQQAPSDINAKGSLKVEPLSRGDLERVCDIETFKKLQFDDNKIFSYRKEFRGSNWCTVSAKIEFFDIYGVMCIKLVPEQVHPGWTPMEQIIVPRALRPLFVKLAHETPEGHLPKYKTMDRISSNFTWPLVNPDVMAHVSNCPQCHGQNKEEQAAAAMGASSQLAMGTQASSQVAMETQASIQAASRTRPGQHRTRAQDSGSSAWFGPQSSEQSAQEGSWSAETSQSELPQPLSRMEILKHCTLEQLSLWQKADPELLPMAAMAVPPQSQCTKPDFTVANSILFRRVPSTATQPATLKVVVPKRLRHAYLSEAHQTKDGRHWQTEVMTSLISANYYWPTIWEDAEEVVLNCQVCNCSRY